MMTIPLALIVYDHSSCTITRLADGVSTSIEIEPPFSQTIATQIHELLQTWNRTPWQLIIALASSDVLHAKIHQPQAMTPLTDQAWSYLLEEALPWTAEEFYAVWLEQPEYRWGLAIHEPSWKPFLELFQSVNYPLPVLIPRVVIDYLTLTEQHQLNPDCLMLLTQPAGVDLLEIQTGKIVSWKWFSSLEEAIYSPELLQTHEEQHKPVYYLNHRGDEQEVAPEFISLKISPTDKLQNCQSLISRSKQNTFIFRPEVYVKHQSQSHLANEFRKLCLTIACLGWMVGGFLCYQAYQDQSQQQHFQNSIDQTYNLLFPNSNQPASLTQIQNELISLKGARLLSDPSKYPEPALKLLFPLLALKEAGIRYNIPEIDISNGLLSISIEVANYEDLNQIISHLKSQHLTVNTANIDQSRQEIISTRLFIEYPLVETNRQTSLKVSPR